MNPSAESERLGGWVHRGLLAGLIVSGLLLVVGLIRLVQSDPSRSAAPPPPLAVLVRQAGRGDAVALIELGLLVLMTTPILRVVVLALGWTIERQPRYAAIALTVLSLLGVSLWMGAR